MTLENLLYTFRILLLVTLAHVSTKANSNELQLARDAYDKSDYLLALSLWQRDARQGDIEAQFQLAELYRKGHGTTRDLNKAAEYYAKSAKQGHAEAQFNLARLYRAGTGVAKNVKTAIMWYEKAAAQEFSEAQFALGLLYENGWGVDRDLALAKDWYQRAANHQHRKASAKLTSLGGQLTVQKMSRYDRRVDLNSMDRYAALRLACIDGQHISLKKLLPVIDNINRPLDEFGNTALMIASEQQHYLIVETLLNTGADISLANTFGQTALHFAVKHNTTDLVSLLLSRKPALNVQDKTGKTPLIEAILHDSLAAMQPLLAEGADVNLADQFDRTPLMHAINQDQPEIVKLLLEANAAMGSVDKSHKSVLQYAIDSKHYAKMVSLLIQHGVDLNQLPYANGNMLHYAIEQNRFEVIPTLLHGKINVDQQDDQGWTPLMRLVNTRHTSVLPQLINATREKNAKNLYGETALIIAAKNNCEICVKWLMEADVNPALVDRHGFNAIAAAIKAGNLSIAKLLISQNALVSVEPMDNGYTLLMLATERGWLDIAELILNSVHEDVNKISNDGKTALSIASARKDQPFVDWLTKQGASVASATSVKTFKTTSKKTVAKTFAGWNALHIAAWENDLAKSETLVQSGVDINALNQNQQTPLMLAALKENCQLLRYLTSKGANATLKDKHGQTALHVAAQQGSVDCVKYLVQHTPSILDQRDRFGRSALMHALQYNKKHAAEKLMIMGADLMLQDKNGVSVLRYAIHSQLGNAAQMIVEFNPAALKNVDDVANVYFDTIQKGHLNLLRHFNRSGLQAQIKPRDFARLIFAAVKSGSREMLVELAEAGIPLQVTDAGMNTPLHIAAAENQQHLLDYLLQQGVSINAENNLRDTPALIAAKTGHFAFTSVLISRGADPHLKNKQGETLRSIAAAQQQSELLNLL